MLLGLFSRNPRAASDHALDSLNGISGRVDEPVDESTLAIATSFLLSLAGAAGFVIELFRVESLATALQRSIIVTDSASERKFCARRGMLAPQRTRLLARTLWQLGQLGVFQLICLLMARLAEMSGPPEKDVSKVQKKKYWYFSYFKVP